MLVVKPGTVAFWKDLFEPDRHKLVYFVGSFFENGMKQHAFFTLSSQAKYLSRAPHRNEMVEIPRGTADYLPETTWIQCFHDLHRIQPNELATKVEQNVVSYRGELPRFLGAIRAIMERSELLSVYDTEMVLNCLL